MHIFMVLKLNPGVGLCYVDFWIVINDEYDKDGMKNDNLKLFLIKLGQYKEFGGCNHKEFKWYNENENLSKHFENHW